MNRKEHIPLGLGCWALGGKGWGGQSEKESMAVMEAAYACGLRHFDTARIYGASEELVGRFIADRRSSIFLASKVYPKGDRSFVRDEVSRSLERLKTDFIDLYYLHWPVEGFEIRDQMEGLVAAREDGLIGSIGVSNYSSGQVREAMEVAPVDYLQVGYHLFWRIIEEDLLPFCRDNGIKVVSYSSLGQGILSGKFGRNPVFPRGDHRADRVIHFQPDVWPHVHAAVEELKVLARSCDRPLSHLAIQWCAARRGVHTVLVGARHAGQVQENAAAIVQPVDVEVLDRMTQISDALMPRLPAGDHIFDIRS